MRQIIKNAIKKYSEISGVVLGIALIGVGGYYLWVSYAQNAIFEKKIGELQISLEKSYETIEQLSHEKKELSEALYSEQEKTNEFEKQIGEIAGTVDILERWSKADPELLKKYSKVYFLNENYIPPELSYIDEEFVYNGNENLQIHSKVLPYLQHIIWDAEEEGIDLRIISAYRSFGTQASLKSGYTVTYGSGANVFSADQGYSEHQLGTTVDWTTPELGAGFSDFEETRAYQWLLDHAWQYGFILSYPEENAHYQFEPWHWRFVGVDLARYLYNEDVRFYDMDQREIDNYLISVFD